MLWLGEKSGFLADWVTQHWVRLTGRRVHLATSPWLDGPVGEVEGIGGTFFHQYACRQGWVLESGGNRGLIEDFNQLSAKEADPAVKAFYEQTSEYDLDAWSEWCGAFRPFGSALALIFSRRLQQLNVPLSSLDTAKGMTSRVLQLRNPETGKLEQTAWVRELLATGNILYAGSYSICHLPSQAEPCIKVAFPLPNGYALVIMKTKVHHDGSLSVQSCGERFGDPGFYFFVQHGDKCWARYVKAMQEEIHVYSAEAETVRADHFLWLFRLPFLRLHYRMRRR